MILILNQFQLNHCLTDKSHFQQINNLKLNLFTLIISLKKLTSIILLNPIMINYLCLKVIIVMFKYIYRLIQTAYSQIAFP